MKRRVLGVLIILLTAGVCQTGNGGWIYENAGNTFTDVSGELFSTDDFISGYVGFDFVPHSNSVASELNVLDFQFTAGCVSMVALEGGIFNRDFLVRGLQPFFSLMRTRV